MLTLYRQRYSKLVALCLSENSLICFNFTGKRKRFHENLKTLPLCTYTREKETNDHATTIKVFLFFQLLERYWLVFSCLMKHLEQGHLPESQCEFRAGRGTIDMIFAAREFQKKCMEQQQDLYDFRRPH